MSMEIYVFSDQRLTAIEDWQQALDRRGAPLRLSAARPFAELSGALPAVLRDRPTAFECDHFDAAELMDEAEDVAFDHRWRHALAFRWGADLAAGEAAFLAAAAYAATTGGCILDGQEGALISPERATDIAAEFEKSGPMIEEVIRRTQQRFGGP
ncbi:hypothetical protein SR870_09945 [Rhodopseudomonas palustris]|uniref:hypothetical protein n=1 Tax=Rhodopseudomonas palustris TaxID=1076 RepID=UPI002ACD816D|nr:hypothetical protein [Rhodopseudomonas palustris]WQH01562.1 hypothetical protein SR870_09945 [Rhodopseudomonas palustris]